MSDFELLRRYEPIVKYTQGERFFPMSAEAYVRRCSLWVHRGRQRSTTHDEKLIPEGELTLARLGELPPAPTGATYYLRFGHDLSLSEVQHYVQKDLIERRTFRKGQGRLARVGYISRLIDAFFSITLLARGRVPSATANSVALKYSEMPAADKEPVYYGKVFRQNGWVALQYWYFFAYNDWRSRFDGVNDHEADWEMVMVYLYEQSDGALVPRWVAYASHDHHGDDLRRRWDDREGFDLMCVTSLDSGISEYHPVVYSGAGSHASYFKKGEYVTEVALPIAKSFVRWVNRTASFWAITLRQGRGKPWVLPDISVPFVDYARGDGASIGPGQPNAWTPVLLDPVPDWMRQYRGLWGLFPRDPIAGENAPAGPMYNRDGSVRPSWYHPLGWAGLDKVPTPTVELQMVRQRRDELRERHSKLSVLVSDKAAQLQTLGSELAAIRTQAHFAKRAERLNEEIGQLSDALKAQRREQSENEALCEALTLRITQLEAGDQDAAHAHIRHRVAPVSPREMRLNKFAEVWGAVSIGLLMIGLVALLYFRAPQTLIWLGLMIGCFLTIEAIFRRSLTNMVTSVTIFLATITTVLLIYHFFLPIVLGGVLLAGLYLLWENLRELRS
ncbi:MAG: hypothetical protein KIH69_021520 [Anaerolineae bacterium]|nr:hypothetical protein [Anaerolineae bacterium]